MFVRYTPILVMFPLAPHLQLKLFVGSWNVLGFDDFHCPPVILDPSRSARVAPTSERASVQISHPWTILLASYSLRALRIWSYELECA